MRICKNETVGRNKKKLHRFNADDPIGSSDVEVVYEKKPSANQVAQATEFKLPPCFYNYEDAPPCPGSRGCEEDTGGE